MDALKNANLDHWDALVPGHFKSDFYDVPGFLSGNSSLDEIELSEVGNVAGKTLLHLQCHFGLSTLSWARLGAIATGVDFSTTAINMAKQLASKTRLDATFIESNILDLSKNLSEKFDIVFTSYGVLCWLPDLEAWGREVVSHLKSGGQFHIIEFHPILTTLEIETDGNIRFSESYFNRGARVYEPDGIGSYATPEIPVNLKTYEWGHSLGEVITALTKAGLKINGLSEYPYVIEGAGFGGLIQDQKGFWRMPDGIDIPLTFSIHASKP